MNYYQNKPFVARTPEGDYFFSDKKEAQAFAMARNGFFDETINIRSFKNKYRKRKTNLKGGDDL